MKNFIKFNKVFLVLVLILAIGSCTKDFEELNTNPNDPTDVPAENIFSHVIVSAINYELGGWIQHTYIGCWSQQWTKIQYIDEDRYQLRDMSGDFNGRYTGTLTDLQVIIDKANESIGNEEEVEKNTTLLAAAKIMRVWIYSLLTDFFGDIPYSEALQGLYKEGTLTPTYDTQENVYTALFTELNEANTLLSGSVISMGASDLLFGGDPVKWRKFANSLRLRLLNRCAGTPYSFTYNMVGTGAETTTAGAAAYSGADADIATILGSPGTYPIMTSNDDNAQLAYPGLPYRNPIFETLYTRTDQGISETMVEWLKTRSDPRLPVYAQETPAYVAGDTTVAYTGQQNGRAHTGAIQYRICLLGTQIAYNENAPVFVLCYDEVEFIKAEYYLRSGDATSANTAYDAGITASMDRWGVGIGGYLSDANVDFTTAAAGGEQYQRVCEQRWAGMFGQGVQAWHLERRTGFPARVFEYELEGTYFPDLGMPVRLPYSVAEESYNGVNVTAAEGNQNIETSNGGMFSTNGTTSQMWWHTRKNPIPTETDVPNI